MKYFICCCLIFMLSLSAGEARAEPIKELSSAKVRPTKEIQLVQVGTQTAIQALEKKEILKK